MTSICKIDLENCFHRAVIKLPFIKSNKIEEKVYVFSVYNPASDSIKMTLINAKLVSESYTSIISRNEFEELKRSQELIIDFNDLPQQLKTLFDQYEEKKLNMRLKIEIDNNVELGFYTMSDVKELTVLTVPFKHTSEEEIIRYLQKRNDILEAQCKNYFERNKALQEKILEQNKQYSDIMATFERTYEEKQNFETRCSQAEHECGKLGGIIDDINNKNLILLRDIQLCQKSNSDLTLSVSELRSDIDSLKIGIEYYIKKTAHLQSVVIEKEKTTVPVDKYDKLNNMFCSAIADLLKCQINLKQILSQHEFQKTENFTLKEELTNCIDMIKNLEKKISVESTKTIPTVAYEEKNDLLSEMIKKLELQNAANTPEKK